MPLPDLQYDGRTSAAGMFTTQQPQVSVLAGGDYDGEEALRQPVGPAAHSSLCAGNCSVVLVFDKKKKHLVSIILRVRSSQ